MTISASDLKYLGCYRHAGVSGASGLAPSWSGPFKGYAFSLETMRDHVRVWRVPMEAAPSMTPDDAPLSELVIDLGPIWQKENHVRTDEFPPFNLIPSLQDPEVHDGQYRAQTVWYDDRQQLLALMITPWYAHQWLPGGGGYPTMAYIDIRPMVTRAEDGSLSLTGNLPIVYGPWRWSITDQACNQIVGYAPADCQAALNEHPEIAGAGPHLLAVGQERSGLKRGSWGPGLAIIQRPNRKTPACDLRVMANDGPGSGGDYPTEGEIAWPILPGALAVHHPMIQTYVNEPGVRHPEVRNTSPLLNPWRVKDGVIRYDPDGPIEESSWELIWGGRRQSWVSFCQAPYYRYTCHGKVYGPTEPAESLRPADELFSHPAWLGPGKKPLPGGVNPYNQDAEKHSHCQLITAPNGRRTLMTQACAYVGARWYGQPGEFVTTDADVPQTAPEVQLTCAIPAGAVWTSPAGVVADRTHILHINFTGSGKASLIVEASEDDGETWEEWWSPGPDGGRRPYLYDSTKGDARYNHLAPPSDGHALYRLQLTAVTECNISLRVRQFVQGGPATERFRSRFFPDQWVYDRSFGVRGFAEEARFMTMGFLPLTTGTVLGETMRQPYSEEVRVVDQWPGFVCDETTMPWHERPIPTRDEPNIKINVVISGGFQRGRRVYLLTKDSYRIDGSIRTGAVINVFEVE